MAEYQPSTWQDYPAGNTPITAAQLNRIEQGIQSASPYVATTPPADTTRVWVDTS